MTKPAQSTTLTCTHCGASAGSDPVLSGNEVFCCEGCRTVYDILSRNGLCEYYEIDPDAAVSLKNTKSSNWNLEELNLMVSEFVISDATDSKTVLFHIPSMHCSSCIWLLEKLPDLDAGIYYGRTDFLKKQLVVSYHPGKTSFGRIVILLRSLGYEPSLMPEDSGVRDKKESRTVLIKLGIAGFCAGNIMLFSFPQYLGLNVSRDPALLNVFNLLNVALSLPLVLYSASDYFLAIKNWIRHRTISVKVPLAIGIGALWLRSLYEVSTSAGGGYFDSLAGLIFFLIAGTWLQNKAFDALRFGEKARKFFPLVARTLVKGKIIPKRVTELVAGDRVKLGHGEVIPADGILMESSALIEYSFATGESAPQNKVAGEVLLGGGRNAGAAFEMEVIRPFSDSRLSDIWRSAETVNDSEKEVLNFEKIISRYFIIGTITIAIAALIYWIPINSSRAWFALTAVLMVACPCALALAPPFAYNIVANFFAKKGLYLRKPEVAGNMGATDAIVFDKTGTITAAGETIAIIPETYNQSDRRLLKSITGQSTHPYSRAIDRALDEEEAVALESYREVPGKGISAFSGEKEIRLGSLEWVTDKHSDTIFDIKNIWFSVNGRIAEPIEMRDVFRENLGETLNGLKALGIELVLASGDDPVAGKPLMKQFPKIFSGMYFNCSPGQKAAIVTELKRDHHVLMVGDGLNDAGALKTGHAGMVVTDSTSSFTPEASAILLQEHFNKMPGFMRVARKANRIVKETFVVSLIYNIIAVGLAFTGMMSPVIAAIMMPASSVTLMVYAALRTKWMVKSEADI